MYKFKFADIGEGLHEGKVGEIYVKTGDKINEGDPLFSVETDKVTSDIPAPVTGLIEKILIKTGQTVHVGDEIFNIDDGSNSSQEQAPPKEKASSDEQGASVVGSIEVSNKLFSANMFKKVASNNSNEIKSNQVNSNSNKTMHQSNANLEIVLPNLTTEKIIGNGEKVDVVILGAGPGGYDLAGRLGMEGLKTIVIENQFAGGVCLNIGCIPTKTLLKGAKVLHYMNHSNDLGLELDMQKVKINWAKMQDRKTKISQTLEKGVEMRIKASKAQFIRGQGEIIDKNNVKVNNKIYTTKYIVIATGSHPIVLPLPGFKEGYQTKHIIDSTGALNLKVLPKKMGIIGGGVIGVEFAILFNELGVDVTILEGANEILGVMDFEIRKWTLKHLQAQNIKIETNVKVTKFDQNKVFFEKDGQKKSLVVDKLLVSIGRKPNNMGLDKKIGLQLGARGEILVNDIMQTNIKNIFAIGDVVGHTMLAHTAYRHAAVVHKAFKGISSSYNQNTIPNCIYIYPEISSIGKTEDQLKKAGIAYEVTKWQNVAIGRALAESDTSGFTKILYEKKYGLILGAHIINYASSEIITEIGAIMEMEGTIFELANTTHPHPAVAEGIYESAILAEEKLIKMQTNKL